MRAGGVPWFSVGLLSAAALAYEILLTRMFALVHWHHLVGMVVSLALLGYGASGSFLALLGEAARRRFNGLFLLNALLFAVTSIVTVMLAASLPLNPMELAWNPRQWGYLAALFGLLAIPFFAAANCIGLALWRFKGLSHRVYGVDLLGAGAGSVAVLALLFVLPPPQLLPWIAVIGLMVVLLGAWELGLGRARLLALTMGLVPAGGGLVLFWSPPIAAPYKDISQALATQGVQAEVQATSPLGVLQLLRNDQVPYRHAPGLSLLSAHAPSMQRALFVDNDSAGALALFDGDTPPAYMGELTSALPYALLERPRVLIPRLGDAGAVLQALGRGARSVTVLEPDSVLVRLLREAYGDSSTAILDHSAVTLQPLMARAFLATHPGRFDLIQLVLEGGGSNLGLQAQQAGFLYTLEAFQAYLKRLGPDGLLAVTRWLHMPPRDSLRLLATARDALVHARVQRPQRHLAMIRDWRTYVLLVSAAPLSPRRIRAIDEFAASHAFDVVWYPGMPPERANRHHRLPEPMFHQAVLKLLGEGAERFAEAYDFRIRPSTDDRPFPYRFTRWSELPRLLREPGGSGYGQLDWGFLAAVATLFIALASGLLLVLLPLLRLDGPAQKFSLKARVLGYFAVVGIGFLFIELAFIQRLQLFLGHPVYATAVVLAGFLVFAGIGSLSSPALCRTGIGRVVLAIALLCACYLCCLPGLLESLMALPLVLKALLVLVVIAPLAFFMGMPFPAGLAQLAGNAPGLLPWAWGVNGCASVVSAAAAPLLAMEIGFSGLLWCAIVLYLLLPWVSAAGRAESLVARVAGNRRLT